MKTVLFIPGFKEKLSSRHYFKTLKAIEAKGYKVEFVQINWLHTTIDDWVEEFDKTYFSYNPDNTILAGFSFGAMTAFATASNRLPSALWLFSLSPYFKEDIPNLKETWLKYIGRRRTNSFKRLSFNSLAKNITCPTLLFVGEKECKMYPPLLTRAKKAHEKIHRSKLVVVPATKHDVTAPKYIELIKENI